VQKVRSKEMSVVLQAVLTWVSNVGGYALAILVVIHSARRSREGKWVVFFPAAAFALFVLWMITMAWYVASIFWVDTYPEHSVPPWLEASSGIAENIQSEVIQVWLAALLFKYLRWPGSPESK
jgi:hypothetical protein